jgi:hypothetical protein
MSPWHGLVRGSIPLRSTKATRRLREGMRSNAEQGGLCPTKVTRRLREGMRSNAEQGGLCPTKATRRLREELA